MLSFTSFRPLRYYFDQTAVNRNKHIPRPSLIHDPAIGRSPIGQHIYPDEPPSSVSLLPGNSRSHSLRTICHKKRSTTRIQPTYQRPTKYFYPTGPPREAQQIRAKARRYYLCDRSSKPQLDLQSARNTPPTGMFLISFLDGEASMHIPVSSLLHCLSSTSEVVHSRTHPRPSRYLESPASVLRISRKLGCRYRLRCGEVKTGC